jgi:MFS transporter, PCFT/HCP family, solute carrier family 46 (folate transporter), member 1
MDSEQISLIPQRLKFNFRIEPIVFLLLFSYNLVATILPNQLLKATCLYDGFDTVNCSSLNNHNESREIEDKIQPKVAEISMVTNLMHSIFPALVSLFIGPWSDKFGRRKALIAVFIGYSLTLIGFSIIAVIVNTTQHVISPWIYIFPHLPGIFTGGWSTLLLLVYCYVSDLTDENDRSSRLTLIEIIVFLGNISGRIISSFIVDVIGSSIIFHIASFSASLATILMIMFLPESVENVEEVGTMKQFRELVSSKPVVEMIKTCFKKRQLNEKKILWKLILILVFSIFTFHGAYNIFYLFLREKFQWTLQDATLFQTFTSIITTVGCIFGITIFKKLLKISDIILLTLSLISSSSQHIIQAFALHQSMMYISVIAGIFSNLMAPMCRSVIASLVPHNEIGKIYSFISAFESVSSVISSPLYTFVYEKTYKTFTGAFLLVTATVNLINLMLSIFISKSTKQRENSLNSHEQ